MTAEIERRLEESAARLGRRSLRRVVNATDPVMSTANAPAAKDVPAAPPVGKNEFKLIGVSEFNLPQHKDHAVIVKGLHIKATPPGMSRLNITSVTTIAPSCPSAK